MIIVHNPFCNWCGIRIPENCMNFFEFQDIAERISRLYIGVYTDISKSAPVSLFGAIFLPITEKKVKQSF